MREEECKRDGDDGEGLDVDARYDEERAHREDGHEDEFVEVFARIDFLEDAGEAEPDAGGEHECGEAGEYPEEVSLREAMGVGHDIGDDGVDQFVELAGKVCVRCVEIVRCHETEDTCCPFAPDEAAEALHG